MHSPIVGAMLLQADSQYWSPGMKRALAKLTAEWQSTSAIGETWRDLSFLVVKKKAENRVNPDYVKDQDQARDFYQWRAANGE